MKHRVALCLVLVAACSGNAKNGAARNSDSAFAAVKERGKGVMGVNQDSAAHVFEDLPDGGRIVLDQKNASDTGAVGTIRAAGAEVDIKTSDASAITAVHAFLEFQRTDHRAAGHDGMDPDEHAMHMGRSALPGRKE